MVAQWYQLASDGTWKSPGRDALSSFTLGATKPDATNTGPAAAGLSADDLTPHEGDWTISEPGTYEGYRVTGLVTITADDVTFRNNQAVSRTSPSYNGGAVIVTSGSNVLIDQCELTGWDPVTSADNTIYWLNGVKITGGDATVQRCNIHDVVDAFKPGSGTLKMHGNYIHSLSFRDDDADQGSGATPPYGSHNDGAQITGGSNHEVIGNNFAMTFSLNTGNPKYINSGWPAGGENALNLDPTWPGDNFGTFRQDNCHGILAQTSVKGLIITDNWFSYAQVGIQFGSGSGLTASISGNRITPNQSPTSTHTLQVFVDNAPGWTITGLPGCVYSDDPFVPEEWRGHTLQDPATPAGQIQYRDPNWELTP